MDSFSYLFILFYLLISIWIIYSDITKNKVYNKQIFVLEGILIFHLIYVFSLWASESFFFDLVFNFISYSVLGVILSLGLYYFKFWAAGDAKLFMHLVPALLLFNFVYSAHQIFFIFLGNLFIVPLVMILIDVLLKTKLRDYRKYFQKHPLEIFNMVMIIFVASWLIDLVLTQFNLRLNSPIWYFAIYMVLFQIRSVFKSHLFLGKYNTVSLILIILSLVRVGFGFRTIFTIDYLLNLVFSVILLMFIRHFAFNVANEHYVTHLTIQNLRPGMILNEPLIIESKKGESLKLERGSKFKQSDLDILNTVKLNRKNHRISIQHHVAFSIFIIIGFFATILLKTLIISRIQFWFQNLLELLQGIF